MKIIISFALLLAAVISFDGESDDVSGEGKKSRKHYGLSYHNKCKDFVKTFTCMTSCKSIGFQIFRMDFKCKCSCHELKTTTILPFFKWRTNGTTKTWARTHSPNLYNLVGTLSPATYPDYDELEGNVTTLAVDSGNSTADGANSTDIGSANATVLEGGEGGAGGDGNSSDVQGDGNGTATEAPAAAEE